LIKAIVWILATYGGYVLIKSVKTEIKQKEDLQVLATKLDEANQHLEELDETKDNFLSMATHELNTPIAAIEGYLSMIVDEKMAGEINDKAMGYLKNVYMSSKRLAALVRDLLNVSRIESNRIHLINEEASIEDVINQAIAEIKIKADEVGHKLVFEKPNKPLPKSWFDVSRITEVVINLMGNSIKYTEPPGKITVRAHADDNKIVVSVEDNGRGIPADRAEHIFEKFSQVDVLKDQVKGTGLGMFISKNLVNLHKGQLWFKSSVDPKHHGTTFYFSLPILKEKPVDENEGQGAVIKLK
jgi:signal transduction histidine kinase